MLPLCDHDQRIFSSCTGSLLKHASSDLKADKGPDLGLLFNLWFEIYAVRGFWFVILRFVVLKIPATSGLVDFSLQSGLLLLALRTSAEGSTRNSKPTTTLHIKRSTPPSQHSTAHTRVSKRTTTCGLRFLRIVFCVLVNLLSNASLRRFEHLKRDLQGSRLWGKILTPNELCNLLEKRNGTI